jgi:hypothetical protein
MVGNNPIVLVGTKMDLLPAGCKPKDVADWLAESAARRRLQVRMRCIQAACAFNCSASCLLQYSGVQTCRWTR